ncbi:MAG TPA: hypothetical protein VNE39_07070 [Planctomycetota bacterium]|nr:hypothetical protein [Planctomycetota bacterium]
MLRGTLPGHLMLRSALIALACLALAGCGSGEEATKPGAEAEPRTWIVNVGEAHDAVAQASLADYDEAVARWCRCRAYEKLAVAEELLRDLASRESVISPAGAQKAEAGNDLSRVAGRAELALERLLGVALPGPRPDSSAEDLAKVHAEASRLVEACRSGIMAGVADHPVPPQEFERLKRKYRGKIDTGIFIATWKNTQAMEDLLGEWPPIGRKMEDLVSIIGAKGEPRKREDGTDVVRYIIREDLNGAGFSFGVQDGIIRSVSRWGLE